MAMKEPVMSSSLQVRTCQLSFHKAIQENFIQFFVVSVSRVLFTPVLFRTMENLIEIKIIIESRTRNAYKAN